MYHIYSNSPSYWLLPVDFGSGGFVAVVVVLFYCDSATANTILPRDLCFS